METALQFCVYLVFVWNAFYFGGVSTLGTLAFNVSIALIALFFVIGHSIAVVRGGTQGALMYGEKAGLTLLSWIAVLGFSVVFSVYRPASFMALGQFISYYLLFVLIVNLFDERSFQSFMRIIFILGIALASFGIVGYFLKDTVLFSFEKHVYLNRLTATFINPNHVASLLGMILPFSLPLILSSRAWERVWWCVGSVVLLVAFFLTFSLAGYLALVLAVLLLYILYGNFIAYPRFSSANIVIKICLFLVIISAAAIALMFLSPELVRAKFFSIWQREGLYRGIIAMLFEGEGAVVRNFGRSLFGGGVGCFRELFHGFYGNFELAEFLHAHNEYVEFFIEAGILGMALFVAFIVLVIARAVNFVRGAADSAIRLAVLACGTSIMFLTIQAWFEFPLRIPLVGATFFAVAGFIMTATTPKVPGTIVWPSVVKYSLIALALFSMLFSLNELIVANLMTRAEKYMAEGKFEHMQTCFKIAHGLAPYNAMVNQNHGLALLCEREAEPQRSKSFDYEALMQFQRMLVKDPYIPEYYCRIGWMLTRAGDREKAEEFFNRGIEVNPQFLLSYLERAHFYLYNDDFKKAADDYNLILDKALSFPESPESRTALLVDEIHRHMLRYQLRPELQAVYNKIAAYREKVHTKNSGQ